MVVKKQLQHHRWEQSSNTGRLGEREDRVAAEGVRLFQCRADGRGRRCMNQECRAQCFPGALRPLCSAA